MLNDLRYRLRALFRRQRVEEEMDEELRFHVERQVAKGIAAGLEPREAARRARLNFGVEQVKEECRQARGVALVESTLQDLRYALRLLRKSPGFATVVVLSLALGIGANTAIFSLIDAVLWKMLPVPNPEELRLVARTGPSATSYGFAYDQYKRLRDESRAFPELAAYGAVRLHVSIDGGIEPTAEGQLVSGSYFSVLGVKPVVGRSIGPDDDRLPNGHPVAMISHGYWERRFASDPAIVGRKIALCGTQFTIIGVTPAEFFGVEVGTAPDIFAPVMMQPALMPAVENLLDNPIIYATWLRVFGRLEPGTDARQAAAALDMVHQRMLEPFKQRPGKGAPPEEKLVLVPASTGLSALRSQFSKPLFVLMAMVGIVLLIACANTANLLLARAAARQSELAMRLSLGAGRGRLIRQMLVESVLLAGLGGLCGLALARWAAELLVVFLSAGRTPIVINLEPDIRVLGFTAAVSLLTGILFGLTPALRALRIDLTPALKGQAGQTTGSRHALRPGKILAVSQVALSLLLLIGAGLFARSLNRLNAQDGGFDRDRVLIVRVEPKGSDQRNIPGVSARLDRTYRDLLERVEVIAGVRSASLAHFTPTTRISFSSPFRTSAGEEISIARLMVYPNYFVTMGMPMIAGRDFRPADLAENAPFVGVVNEAFVRRFFNGENVVGRQYVVPRRSGDIMGEIIGVVRDSRYASLRGETPPVIYQPFLQTNTGRGQMVLHTRVAGDPNLVVPRIREEILKVDKDLPVFEVRTLATEMDAALVQERLIATLASFFGALALVLACVGLYGLMAFSVVRRRGEIGIRMALGAGRGDVVAMILRETLLLVLIGVAVGVPTAVAVARVASSQIAGLLFGLEATDPVTILGAAMVLTAVALLAGYVPARRAARVDPMVALRHD